MFFPISAEARPKFAKTEPYKPFTFSATNTSFWMAERAEVMKGSHCRLYSYFRCPQTDFSGVPVGDSSGLFEASSSQLSSEGRATESREFSHGLRTLQEAMQKVDRVALVAEKGESRSKIN
jgi:hypothetical protein